MGWRGKESLQIKTDSMFFNQEPFDQQSRSERFDYNSGPGAFGQETEYLFAILFRKTFC